ncbi:MAG: DUF2309 domain-containing protein [Magnetococcales bacterium]|nr:DUF2309 domain-containing protein [Magnetococcales bacterium]
MTTEDDTPQAAPLSPRERVQKAIDHFDHILPGQAPLKDFVHHNTLHGYETQTFYEAVEAAEKKTGIYGFLPKEKFRAFFNEGRITTEDLSRVLDGDPELEASEEVVSTEQGVLAKRDVYLCGLRHDFDPLTPSQLGWQVEEMGALERFQPDLPPEVRGRLLRGAGAKPEAEILSELWSASLNALGLKHYILHPEELLDLSPDQAQTINTAITGDGDTGENEGLNRWIRHEAERLLKQLLSQIGSHYTVRGLLKSLTGIDILEEIRPHLIRQLSSHLDLGVAAWHNPKRKEGFYASWRANAAQDLAWMFDDMLDWHDQLTLLPDDPLDAVISELHLLGVPEESWTDYLDTLALELPGWAGQFQWRAGNPGYSHLDINLDMAGFLAVRLILERLFAHRLCRRTFNVTPDLDLLRWYFRNNRHEFLVRYSLFHFRLPEYALHRAQRLVSMVASRTPPTSEEWQQAAHLIWTWRHSPMADSNKRVTVYHHGWRLFRLVQLLGLDAETVAGLSLKQVETLFGCIDRLTPMKSGFLWLQAYENHYRDEVFNAVVQNHGRGRWNNREKRPEAQIVFCMDDREESIRRQLEELNPRIETLGAAGFFGVAINWQALDDEEPTALCPVVVSPAHKVTETVSPEHRPLKEQHQRGRKLRLALTDFLLNGSRHHLLSTAFVTALAAPAALVALTSRILAPDRSKQMIRRLLEKWEPKVPTGLALTAEEDGSEATPLHNRLGFTDTEQADRVMGFLKTVGLTSGFAPLFVVMGHGSISENNPLLAAYDCGACSGRHGGPNARVFAAMANRPRVRDILRQRGIDIPDDTWFVGAKHNTCNDGFSWYDISLMPESFTAPLKQLEEELVTAARGSAHERCRRFEAISPDLSPQSAAGHVRDRGHDISQARPEFNHATNAVAFIGRRAISQGAFFDRRVFLISYDPTIDADGKIVENILLNAGPVGAGINLEYYFSTVSPDEHGCSSKITHNVAGHFGIMDGSESDLRTGLPIQTTEIHEPMRLQVLVEATMDILTEIYMRQPPLQELVGNGWLLLSAKDPQTDAIHLFDPKKGWVPWQELPRPLPTVERSKDWYQTSRTFLSPVLIRQPEEMGHG